MAILKVARMGHPILRKTAEKINVNEIKTPTIKQLILDMHDTMKDYGGVGIAAPQVHVSKQIAIMEIESGNERYKDNTHTPLTVFINPIITVLDPILQGFYEGCLSVPHLRGYVERPRKIQIEFLNENAENKIEIYEGFLATVIQHELDHLFGTLYIDRIKDYHKLAFTDEYQRYHINN